MNELYTYWTTDSGLWYWQTSTGYYDGPLEWCDVTSQVRWNARAVRAALRFRVAGALPDSFSAMRYYPMPAPSVAPDEAQP